MRRLILVFAIMALALCVGGTLLLGDVFLNGHRLLDAAIGRAKLVDACRPAVLAQLRAAGFQPSDMEFGDDVVMAWSSGAGRSLGGPITFQDGASQARVDGEMTCRVVDGHATAEVRTDTTPLRAT